MGASNALAAFRLYAGKIPPLSMNLLTYMALISLDRDSEPRYWEGHAALAVHCLGREEAPVSDSDLRAVRRAITPLFAAGAITVARHSSPDREKPTVSYRLWLTAPAPDGKRPVNNRRPTGASPDGNRPPKEYEETEEREEKQEYPLPLQRAVPVGPREPGDDGEDFESRRKRFMDALMAFDREQAPTPRR